MWDRWSRWRAPSKVCVDGASIGLDEIVDHHNVWYQSWRLQACRIGANDASHFHQWVVRSRCAKEGLNYLMVERFVLIQARSWRWEVVMSLLVVAQVFRSYQRIVRGSFRVRFCCAMGAASIRNGGRFVGSGKCEVGN